MTVRRTDGGRGCWFALWFGFVALVNLALLAALIWLIVEVAQWIGRQR